MLLKDLMEYIYCPYVLVLEDNWYEMNKFDDMDVICVCNGKDINEDEEYNRERYYSDARTIDNHRPKCCKVKDYYVTGLSPIYAFTYGAELKMLRYDVDSPALMVKCREINEKECYEEKATYQNIFNLIEENAYKTASFEDLRYNNNYNIRNPFDTDFYYSVNSNIIETDKEIKYITVYEQAQTELGNFWLADYNDMIYTQKRPVINIILDDGNGIRKRLTAEEKLQEKCEKFFESIDIK